ncbi:hypothetical protein GCM10010317_040900 [Streptomyces mirabilis]|nr:hypothetical protein GCM10010317_040900 [Streptomyces mirabilis]
MGGEVLQCLIEVLGAECLAGDERVNGDRHDTGAVPGVGEQLLVLIPDDLDELGAGDAFASDPGPSSRAWECDLLGDQLPWHAWENEEATRTELTAWLVRNAPARLRAHGVSEELLHRIRLLGLTGHDRWEDPHWPGHRY